MFHLGMWRERLRDAMRALADGEEYTRPSSNIDELNDAELERGIGTPLADAAARSDQLLTELIELYARVGERPFEWHISRTTTEALLRNSYTHARVHLHDYYMENGAADQADRITEQAYADMKEAGAPPLVMGAALYNLAVVRTRQGHVEDALRLLGEAFPMRPDIKSAAPQDADLGELRTDPRFEELVRS